MNTTKTCLSELKRLVKEAKENIYRRCELASTVLNDLDWIASEHGGSELKAQDALAHEFFPDLNGYVSLGKLVLMFRNVSKAEWSECRYDIAAVEAVFDEQRGTTTEEVGKRTSWKKLATERAERIKELESQIERFAIDNERLSAENADLHSRVSRLEGALEERRQPVRV